MLFDVPIGSETLPADGRAYAWVARIESVWQEPGNRSQGEPGLKFAELTDVAVIASRSGGNE